MSREPIDRDLLRPIPGFHPLAPMEDVDALKHPTNIQYSRAQIPSLPKREPDVIDKKKKEPVETESESKPHDIVFVGSGGSTDETLIVDTSKDPRAGTDKAASIIKGMELLRKKATTTGNMKARNG